MSDTRAADPRLREELQKLKVFANIQSAEHADTPTAALGFQAVAEKLNQLLRGDALPPPPTSEKAETLARVDDHGCVPEPGTTAQSTNGDAPSMFTKNPDGDWVCEHGTASDVHCCGCHSGFLFDSRTCICF